jgi:site-specific DNA recombinase
MTATLPQVIAGVLRVVLYGRTSKDVSEGRSVDDQLALLTQWATEAGHHIVDTLRDDGRSASRFGRKPRPDWEEAMRLINTGAVDVLAVWELSRATREREQWAAFMTACIRMGVKVAVEGRMFDPRDPDDAHALDQTASSDTRESEKTRKRVKRAVDSRAESGKPHGALVYGLAIEFDTKTGAKKRVLDEEKAKIVRDAAKRLLDGQSLTQVCRDLNERDVPSPRGGRWYPANLMRLLTRPSLAALREHQGKVKEGVVGTWPAILTHEQHRALVALAQENARGATRNGTHRTSLLVGAAFCDVCESGLRVVTKVHRERKRLVYACRVNHCVSRSLPDVDNQIERLVVARLSMPDVVAELTADDPAAEEARQALARMDAKIEEYRRLVDEDELEPSDLADLRRRQKEPRAAAERALRPRGVPPVVMDTAGADAAERWAALDVNGRRTIIKALLDIRVKKAAPRSGYLPYDPTGIAVTWKR